MAMLAGTMDEPHLDRRRIADFFAFTSSHLPPPPARVLEIGCGRGDLARALARAGHAVTAIDPQAPKGSIFRQVRLEDFDDSGPYDAVLASVSLHHVDDLAAALERIGALLRPDGILILEEFAKERLEGATARWYHRQRQALAAIGREDADVPGDFEAWHRQWTTEHADIHSFTTLRRELDGHLVERVFEWTPYLYSYRLDDSLEPLERRLIAAGEIEPTGFRYVGERAAQHADARD